jgi:hypothetical protein
MTRLGIFFPRITFLLALAGSLSFGAEPPASAPDFKEVYDLIRDHLAGVDDAELDKAAVQGLLSALAPKVSLVKKTEPSVAQDTLLITKTSLFDGPIGYIRVSRVADGLDQSVSNAWQEIAATNKLNGLVLDLRYASDNDYAAAAATADLFARKEQPLLDWGNGMVRSKEKTESLAIPTAVLVNRETSSAAEALAALLREIGAGLVLGSRTAGQAMIAQEYPLKDGDRLRIATAPIQLGDGSSLSSHGISPDIAVDVPASEERAYYDEPFKDLPRLGSVAGGSASPNAGGIANRSRRPRFNEAELVRERRDGSILDTQAGAGGNDSEKPVVHDPALARALDFLKGLSVIRQTRS